MNSIVENQCDFGSKARGSETVKLRGITIEIISSVRHLGNYFNENFDEDKSGKMKWNTTVRLFRISVSNTLFGQLFSTSYIGRQLLVG